MTNNNKDLFQLIEEHKEAQYQAAKHYFECEICQRHYHNLEAPECEEHTRLKKKADETASEIEAYKIDIS